MRGRAMPSARHRSLAQPHQENAQDDLRGKQQGRRGNQPGQRWPAVSSPQQRADKHDDEDGRAHVNQGNPPNTAHFQRAGCRANANMHQNYQ